MLEKHKTQMCKCIRTMFRSLKLSQRTKKNKIKTACSTKIYQNNFRTIIEKAHASENLSHNKKITIFRI